MCLYIVCFINNVFIEFDLIKTLFNALSHVKHFHMSAGSAAASFYTEKFTHIHI